jgi:hypothetical protein
MTEGVIFKGGPVPSYEAVGRTGPGISDERFIFRLYGVEGLRILRQRRSISENVIDGILSEINKDCGW